jgi:hypothetical protein
MMGKSLLDLVDITEVNTYIMYLDQYRQGLNPMRYPMTHLQL